VQEQIGFVFGPFRFVRAFINLSGTFLLKLALRLSVPICITAHYFANRCR
jgi:hypothetical protein